MKNMLLFILAIIFMSCQQRPSEMTPEAKDVVKKEISSIVSGILQSLEKSDIEAALKPYSSSTDFIAVNTDGSIVDYQGLKNANVEAFKILSLIKFTTGKEYFRFLSDSLVLYTWVGSAEQLLKSGEHSKTPAYVATLLFSKVNYEWKVIYSHESASPSVQERPKK